MKKILALFVIACSLVLCVMGAYKVNNVKAAEANKEIVCDSSIDPRNMSDEEIAVWQERNMANGIILGLSVSAAIIVIVVCSVIYDKKHKGANGHSARAGISSGSSFGGNAVIFVNGLVLQPDAEQYVAHMEEKNQKSVNKNVSGK